MKTVLILGLSLLVNFTKAHATNNLKLEESIDFNNHSKSFSALSFEKLKKKKEFLIGDQSYGIHINHSLEKHLKDEKMQLELIEVIKSLQKNTPYKRIEGYSFSYSPSDKSIYASPYLGMNAK